MRSLDDLKESLSNYGCRWYPRGNATVEAGARYFQKLGIGIWASVIRIDDGVISVFNDATNGEADPNLIGAAQALKIIHGSGDCVQFLSSSKSLVEIMQSGRRIAAADRIEAECWRAIFGLGKSHRVKWQHQEFKYDYLLREDSPLVRAVLDARERETQM